MESINISLSDPYQSLYDFLGKAAGAELGHRVATAAYSQKVHVVCRDINTRTYVGKVSMYPRSFLQNYFNNNPVII